MAAPAGGSIVTRKLGPLPAWAWLAILAVGVYLYSKRTVSAAGVQTQSVQAATPDSSSGLVPSAGSGAGGVSSTDALLQAYGQQGSELLSALANSEANVTQLAGQQLAYNASQTTNGVVDTSTGANVASQPGGSNAPTFAFSFPGVTNAAVKATSTVTAVKKAATPAKPPSYSTYKRNVQLKAGQTVHFASGKGYYAA